MKAYLTDLAPGRDSATFDRADKASPLAATIIAGAVADEVDALVGAGRNALARLWSLNERRRQRQALAELDPHLLRDIGIDPHEAMAEATKPFWRA